MGLSAEELENWVEGSNSGYFYTCCTLDTIELVLIILTIAYIAMQ